MNNTALQFVGMWIRDSKPAPITYYPHDCIIELAGVCQGCEDRLEWNYCVLEEWIEEYTSFFATCSCAQAATGYYDSWKKNEFA